MLFTFHCCDKILDTAHRRNSQLQRVQPMISCSRGRNGLVEESCSTQPQRNRGREGRREEEEINEKQKHTLPSYPPSDPALPVRPTSSPRTQLRTRKWINPVVYIAQWFNYLSKASSLNTWDFFWWTNLDLNHNEISLAHGVEAGNLKGMVADSAEASLLHHTRQRPSLGESEQVW